MSGERRARLRRPSVLIATAVVAAASAAVVIVRVPPGSIGVARSGRATGRVLEAGLHLRAPLQRVDVYATGAASTSGRHAALTREGASLPVDVALRARVDPARAHLLPESGRGGTSGLPETLARVVAQALEDPLEDPGTDGLPARLRGRLESRGLIVETLEVSTGAPPAASPPGRRLRSPILLVGLDGADWQLIDPLIERGRLPRLARLKAASIRGHLRSYEPILSPLLWTTAATGKSPDEHGILDFLVPDAATGRRVPISSRQRRVKALWNMFSERDLASDVVAWWASWPAEPIRGRVVSDRVAYSLFHVEAARAGSSLTWPEDLMQELGMPVVPDAAVDYAAIARFLDVSREEFDASRRRATADPQGAYKEPINHLTKILASTRTYHQAALALLGRGQADLTMVYYQGIDEVGHRFMHFAAPKMAMVSEPDFRRYRRAVEEFYVYQDELLGELLDRASPESTVLVMSDHGFQNGSSRPTDGPADIEGKPGRWHRLYGMILIAGPGIAPGRLDTATLYDVAPTVLSLAGLPLAADMKGSPLLRRPADGDLLGIASYEAAPGAVVVEPARAGGAAISEADEELLRNLASLGYIGPASAATAEGADGGAGPMGRAAAAETDAPPETVTAHTNLAAVLIQKGDLAGAEAELRRALQMQPAYFPAMISLAQALVRQGRVEEALETTGRALRSADRPQAGAYVQLALLAVRAGRPVQAESLLRQLAGLRPEEAGIPAALGALAAEAGDSPGAERHLRAALAIDPACAEAMARLFQIRREAGREAELEPEVRRALQTNERSVLHHNWLGLILSARGRTAEAEASFRRALDLAPDFGGTMVNLGSLYGRQGRLEEAAAVLSRAVRIEPKNSQARVNLGAALAKVGRLDEAIASLEEARRLGLRSTELLNAVGLAYAERGRMREAIQALSESLALAPDQPQVKSLLAELRAPS